MRRNSGWVLSSVIILLRCEVFLEIFALTMHGHTYSRKLNLLSLLILQLKHSRGCTPGKDNARVNFLQCSLNNRESLHQGKHLVMNDLSKF